MSNLLISLDVSNNTALEFLTLGDIPTLFEVCVWETFSLDSVEVWSMGSPNAYFTTECSNGTMIELDLKKEFSIYPNPTNTLLTIETEYPDHYSIEITSLNDMLTLPRYGVLNATVNSILTIL